MPDELIDTIAKLAAGSEAIAPGDGVKLARLRRAHDALIRSIETTIGADDEAALLAAVCELIVADCGYRMAWVGYPDPARPGHVRAVAQHGNEDGYLTSISVRWDDTPEGRGPTGVAIRTRTTSIARDIHHDEAFAPWRAQAVQRGYASSIALPLNISADSPGALSIYAVEPDAFDPTEVALLQRLADNLAFAVATLRARAERDAAAELLRAIYQASPDMIFLHGADGRIVEVNDRTTGVYQLGRETILRAAPERLVGTGSDVADAFAHLQQALAGHARDFEWMARTGDGRDLPVEVRLRRIAVPDDHPSEARVIALVRDLSDRKHAEAEQVRADRLAALGVLAGGIAHDFNNLLAGILGNLSLAQLRLRDTPTARTTAGVAALLDEAVVACERSRDLTRQLLTFAKGGHPLRAPAHLGPVVRHAAEFALHGAEAICHFDLPAALWPGEIDAGQIGQVVQNLVINAFQSIRGQGRIDVGAANVVLDADHWLCRTIHLAPGDYVEVTVRDTGPGVPAAVAARIFDPYFTTKPGGSGLGLATATSVVHNHGGHLWLASAPARPAEFRFVVPRGPEPDPVVAPPAPAPARALRVLVMDDEPAVRRLAAHILATADHTVECAASGEEALACYVAARDQGRGFDVVVLDLTVPGGLGGVETMARLRALDPGVRGIASSGYATGDVMAAPTHHGFVDALAKPYRADDLLAAVVRAAADPVRPQG